MLLLSGVNCNAQKYCQQAKLEFTDANAPESLKKLTVERLNRNVNAKKQQAEIKLEDGIIVAKMTCDGNEATRHFRSEKFAIYETYEAAELESAIAGIAKISDTRGVPFDQLTDTRFAYGASIGTCPINRMEQFKSLVNLPECKKLLPTDIIFAFGIPEKDAGSVPVFAVKII